MLRGKPASVHALPYVYGTPESGKGGTERPGKAARAAFFFFGVPKISKNRVKKGYFFKKRDPSHPLSQVTFSPMKKNCLFVLLMLGLVFCEKPYVFSRGEAVPVFTPTWVVIPTASCEQKNEKQPRFRIPLEIKVKEKESGR
ncbi:hypothetical protein Thein_1927 [Thermodesulfatator indicus DSM 15286]|uniref:Uncharacterized protein n=1 Tax=Thermodesulfatator indicus (strain DSM 15286 / JCM 11887 / CIR29812) TaxID=667014 RepID=F8ACK7_THEID|nr:hypothetical protein Thein_1927 [Thermodesulfatator indicus DSM 15286]